MRAESIDASSMWIARKMAKLFACLGGPTQFGHTIMIFIFVELLRCILDCTNNIQMYFVHTNAIETIVGVGVVSLFSKNEYR